MTKRLCSAKSEEPDNTPWERDSQWTEALFGETFRVDKDSSDTPEHSGWDRGRGPKGRLRASFWSPAEVELLYELFIPRFEDWRSPDPQPAVRSLRKRNLLKFIESELISSNLNDPPKTTVQIDDKLKNDFKKVREKIILEESGKRGFQLPHPLCLFEEMVRNDRSKMTLLKIRSLDPQPRVEEARIAPFLWDRGQNAGEQDDLIKKTDNGKGAENGWIVLDDDSREGSSECSKTKETMGRDDDDDMVDIEEILAINPHHPLSIKKPRNVEPNHSSSQIMTKNASTSIIRNQPTLQKLLETPHPSNSMINTERLATEDLERTVQLQRLANEKQKARLLEREEVFMGLQEEILHAKLETARAKRRYYERKTQLTYPKIRNGRIDC